MDKKPNKRVLRGLRWIHSQAGANFDVCRNEDASTGQFPGTTPKEVEAAFDWLNEVIRSVDSSAASK